MGVSTPLWAGPAGVPGEAVAERREGSGSSCLLSALGERVATLFLGLGAQAGGVLGQQVDASSASSGSCT